MHGFYQKARDHQRVSHTNMNRCCRRMDQDFNNAVLDSGNSKDWEEDIRRIQAEEEVEEIRYQRRQ